MKTPSHISVSAALAMVSNRVVAGGLVLLSILFLGVSSARALPVATLDNCPSNWTNNPGAMQCEQQGEQDIINGVTDNHYVACDGDGTLLCCTGSAGHQDCQEITDRTLGTRSPLGDLQGSVQFGGLQVTTSLLNQIQQEVQQIKTEVDNLSQQCPPPPVH